MTKILTIFVGNTSKTSVKSVDTHKCHLRSEGPWDPSKKITKFISALDICYCTYGDAGKCHDSSYREKYDCGGSWLFLSSIFKSRDGQKPHMTPPHLPKAGWGSSADEWLSAWGDTEGLPELLPRLACHQRIHWCAEHGKWARASCTSLFKRLSFKTNRC